METIECLTAIREYILKKDLTEELQKELEVIDVAIAELEKKL